jgi:AcrR family transcriptional regulator
VPDASAERAVGAPDGEWRERVVGRSLGPAAERALEQANALLVAAARLLRRSGEDSLTMQKVAAEAGLSMRAVYKHFSGKDDLLVALVEETQTAFARVMEWHADQREDPLEKLGAALYYATDSRQHPDHAYNVAMARYTIATSVTAPAQLGQARRPTIQLLAGLVRASLQAGQLPIGDPESGAAWINLAYVSLQWNTYFGSSIGAPLPGNEAFIRYCIDGLGASLPAGWEQQFVVNETEARRLRRVARRIAEQPRSIRSHDG